MALIKHHQKALIYILKDFGCIFAFVLSLSLLPGSCFICVFLFLPQLIHYELRKQVTILTGIRFTFSNLKDLLTLTVITVLTHEVPSLLGKFSVALRQRTSLSEPKTSLLVIINFPIYNNGFNNKANIFNINILCVIIKINSICDTVF